MSITISKLRRDSDVCRNQNYSRLINRTVHSIRRKPLKGRLVVFYNSLYNKLFHRGLLKLPGEWSDLVGSYTEDTCVNSSDIDFMTWVCNAFTDPKHIPVDYKNALLVITDKEEIPPGSCWLRAYNTLKGDRYGDPVPNRNGLEWFYHCDEYSPLDKAYFICKVKEFDGHSHFPYTSALNKIPCLRPAIVENKDGYQYFSRAKTEEYFGKRGFTLLPFVNRFLPKFLDNGPAFKQKYFGCFDIDVVYAIYCESGWPASAHEWTIRTRNWPELSMVEEICRSGFQVVPIGSKLQLSVDQDLEWRISFRCAETKLVKSFSDCQRTCFIVLKILVKEFIGKKFPEEDFVSSYTMKTIMFWTIEETESSVWKEDNIVACLEYCLERLKRCLKDGFLPNYFIKDYNLFRTKLQRMFILGFREWLVSQLDLYGWRIILKCKSFAAIHVPDIKAV